MKWIYRRSGNNKYRYVLGYIIGNPNRVLICFGVNPSTARPNNLDRTLNKVKILAKNNGYDSWIMLNISPERATKPNNMSKCQNKLCKIKNDMYIKKILCLYANNSDILFAYGNLISKRYYLKSNLDDIIRMIKAIGYKGNILCIKKTKLGNPVHPLYQNQNALFQKL